MTAEGPYINARDPHGSRWQVTTDHAQARVIIRDDRGQHYGAWRPMADVRLAVGPLTLEKSNG